VRILVVFGTRPEAIKLAPLIHELRTTPGVDVRVCSTAQHREMTDQVVQFFRLPVDYDLNLMQPEQTLSQLTSRLFSRLEPVVQEADPDVVIVQGDTTTAFAAAMAGFYARKPVAHVEAGLRSRHKFAPFPEEINRRLISHIADYHFAPTPRAQHNLVAEGVREHVWMVGNTVIDALFLALRLLEHHAPKWDQRGKFRSIDFSKRILLVTAHRRENFGAPLREISLALRDLVQAFPEIEVVFPVHPNPRVQQTVSEILAAVPRIHLLPPLSYPEFVGLMQRSYLVLTDSGGVQEEAPSLGKPVLVLREVTERVEGIEAGVARLVGTQRARIVAETSLLLTDQALYQRMAQTKNPYGDGDSALKIKNILLDILSAAATTKDPAPQ